MLGALALLALPALFVLIRRDELTDAVAQTGSAICSQHWLALLTRMTISYTKQVPRNHARKRTLDLAFMSVTFSWGISVLTDVAWTF